MHEWPDIPGVTAVDGRARLPRDPRTAASLLAHAMRATHDGAPLSAVVDDTLREVRTERSRLEGLAGWLPLSRVLRWEAGRLVATEGTGLVDVSVRFAAWFSTQPTPDSFAEGSREYARQVVAEGTRLAASDPRAAHPASGRAAPEPPTVHVPAAAASSILDPEITARLRRILASMDGSFLERRQHVRASLLALLARQHVLLLGPPGTAKSMLARALCTAFADATYFEYLLSRFTHPDELFGPVSIPGLKVEDYRRITEGFLPRAQVAFLDEIFKANSAILNSLLTLINERVFHHGRHRDAVPLIGVLGASNELPDPEGGLGALFDRFLVRMLVPPLEDASAFLAVATGTVPAPAIDPGDPLGAPELAAILVAAESVEVPPEVSDALVRLWQLGQQHDWLTSDRRWRQAVAFLKVAAATDGRSALTPLDLLLLEHVLPPEPDRAPEVREALIEQLGTRSVPTHDLRAQWLLLNMDRVAPIDDGPIGIPPDPQTPWTDRLPVRRAQLDRYLQHHTAAVTRLASDRSTIEDAATTHLWVAKLPSQVLASHIRSSRELVGILKVAETYGRTLASPDSLAAAHLDALPIVERRIYGYGTVLVLAVLPARGDILTVGLTTSGEREPLSKTRKLEPRNGLVRPTDEPLLEVPYVELPSTTFLDFIDGTVTIDTLISGLRASAGPNVRAALGNVRKTLGKSAIPRPPILPAL